MHGGHHNLTKKKKYFCWDICLATVCSNWTHAIPVTKSQKPRRVVPKCVMSSSFLPLQPSTCLILHEHARNFLGYTCSHSNAPASLVNASLWRAPHLNTSLPSLLLSYSLTRTTLPQSFLLGFLCKPRVSRRALLCCP